MATMAGLLQVSFPKNRIDLIGLAVSANDFYHTNPYSDLCQMCSSEHHH
jgi:hypothetical protein